MAFELYGKGYVLGPDAGIGLYLYSGLDYAEYYSQFPSHNTGLCRRYIELSGNEEQPCFPYELLFSGTGIKERKLGVNIAG